VPSGGDKRLGENGTGVLLHFTVASITCTLTTVTFPIERPLMSTAGQPIEFTIRRKVFKIFGGAFHIYNADGSLFGYSRQKAFKLKEDIRVYTDESMQTERLRIAARQIIDFSAAYDVYASDTNQKLGAFKRKGWASLIKDSWVVMDANDQPIGQIEEDGMALALLRRVVNLGTFLPQSFHLSDSNQQTLAKFRTHFNPFIHRLTVTMLPGCSLSPQLVLSAGILLVAIEGRQK
jgi:hypothetical protein